MEALAAVDEAVVVAVVQPAARPASVAVKTASRHGTRRQEDPWVMSHFKPAVADL